MIDAPPPSRGLRIHPVDLLVLVLAAGLAALVLAYTFRTTPSSRPVDALLGAVIEVEFRADREWKRAFPAPGAPVVLENFLVCDLESADPSGETVRLALRVRAREAQRPEAMTHFRARLRRGTRVRLHDADGEVEAEVVSVTPGNPPR